MNFYEECATILDKLRRRQGSVKSLCLHPKIRDKKKTYALVCESLKVRSALDKVIVRSGLLTLEPKLSQSLAVVLLHDFFFARRGIQCGGWQKFAVTRHKDVLRDALVAVKKETAAAQGERLDPAEEGRNATKRLLQSSAASEQESEPLPRYARVNRLGAALSSTASPTRTHEEQRDAVIVLLTEEGWQDGGVLTDWRQMRANTTYRDQHLPDLLAFPANTDLHAHALVQSGALILQDKASCFPATVLAPPLHAHAIDACAAPGNKTSHLASIMANTGRITAFDLSSVRLDTLRKLTHRAGCKNIDAVNANFLDVKPTDKQWRDVEYILLDPSCSGSGIVNRLDQLVDAAFAEDQDDEQLAIGKSNKSAAERLQDLADFQLKMILHAMQFPNVKRISYSTCSIHAIENERVVANALARQTAFQLCHRAEVLPSWPSRGQSGEGLTSDQVLRASPSDGTNGFFVALFERVASSPNDQQATETPRSHRHAQSHGVAGKQQQKKKSGTQRAKRKKIAAVNA
ncbi:hypothetical protein RI367_006241 [Sorochytrium milnesiophthora]